MAGYLVIGGVVPQGALYLELHMVRRLVSEETGRRSNQQQKNEYKKTPAGKTGHNNKSYTQKYNKYTKRYTGEGRSTSVCKV